VTRRSARRLVALYLAAYTLATTFPGILLVNRVRPPILGLPFVFFWVAVWVGCGAIVLYVMERATTRDEAAARAADRPSDRAG
jgi:hypothetical protein